MNSGSLQQALMQGDAISHAVALVLLAMSLASWAVIFYKGWQLWRASASVQRAVAGFWQSATLGEAAVHAAASDHSRLALPLIEAAQAVQRTAAGTLAGAGSGCAARLLRQALLAAEARLQFGQTLLATVGATAPFVGLLGTVWGIYHALIGISGSGQMSIERVAGPVGESLVMTAAGLAAAIPAVLAYNWFQRSTAGISAELEGFAADLLQLLADGIPQAPAFAAVAATLGQGTPAFLPQTEPAAPLAPAVAPAAAFEPPGVPGGEALPQIF